VNQRIWVTGATGYTGKFLVRLLAATVSPGTEIVGLSRSCPRSRKSDIFYHPLDLSDPLAIRSLARREPPDLVFHLAGMAPPAPESFFWQVNVGGTVNLLQELYSAGCRKTQIVCVGSAAEYHSSPEGRMTEDSPAGGGTPYGRSKWSQTNLAMVLGHNLGFQVKIARPFNIIGPGLPDRLVAGRICRKYLDPAIETIKMGNITSERDFVDVRDVVRGYWIIANYGQAGEIYNICSGEPTSIKKLLELFFQVGNSRKEVAVDKKSLRRIDFDRVYGSNEKLKQLGWQQEFSLAESVADMMGSVTL